MNCPKCNSDNIGIAYPDGVTMQIRCVCGIHFMFLYRGVWEDNKTRMARMERIFTCKVCKHEIKTYADNHEGNPRTICEPCSYKTNHSKRVWIPASERKKNSSPWRTNFVIMKSENKCLPD